MAVPLAVVAVVVVLIIPLPTFLIDLLITLNITGSLLVLLTAMQVKRALDFSVFPTWILIATMFRLALNVAVTREVLLHGYAGVVVQSFGHFVIGGSIVVGLVVFFILVIIQFVVITSGSGRVAEVAARFTLDEMPGKQMAIDADRTSGAIDEHEAKRRRQEVADEADFYGAMDGASKFVRGDAIAAIVITMVNLIGGLAIGILQRHLSITKAIDTYSLLSVGDGLVSQIPALLLSLSTGIIVTRAATDHDLGHQVVQQLWRYRKIVRTAGGIMTVLAIIPGLPRLPFLVIGITVFIFGSRLPQEARTESGSISSQNLEVQPQEDTPEIVASRIAVEPITLELGIDLIDLVQPQLGGDLLERVRILRRNIASELGIVMPSVHTRDNLDLGASTYVIKIHGITIGEGEAPQGKVLAIGGDLEGLPGDATLDPAFQGKAKWIPIGLSHQASLKGLTVVDRSAVITTHLSEIVKRNAGTLLSRQDTKLLLDALKNNAPVVLDEMTASNLSLGEIQTVLRELLNENIPINDLVRIIESLTEQARSQQRDIDSLVEAARIGLARTIEFLYKQEDGVLHVITVAPNVEQELLNALRITEKGQRQVVIPASRAEAIIREIAKIARDAEASGLAPVLICATKLRPALKRLLTQSIPELPVLGINEIDGNVRIVTVGSVIGESVEVA
ncbi:MAG: flagellar biosynthesis protein FlhA [Actinobacteria bacterium]|nr:flagellar biosynthesis protein FlhA [Actinomycetota bacterium]